MSVVKRAMLLLLLAAIGTNAAPGPEDCGSLNKTLPTKDLHKISGDWVLVWSVPQDERTLDLMINISSSHVNIQVLPDNNTVVYDESNMYLDKSCVKYFLNMSIPSDLSNLQQLRIGGGTLKKDGVVLLFNDTAEVDFYETCSDCMVMIYRSELGHFLLSYRREGQHQDAELLKAAHSDHKKLAECLGFPHDKPIVFDGAADFCHKKSSPAVDPEQS